MGLEPSCNVSHCQGLCQPSRQRSGREAGLFLAALSTEQEGKRERSAWSSAGRGRGHREWSCGRGLSGQHQLGSEEGVTAEGPVALMNCSKDRNRVKHHGWHWPTHARPQAQLQLCKVFPVAADEVGKAALEYLPLTASFQNALEEKLHADPLILLSSRLQSYPRYRADPSVQNSSLPQRHRWSWGWALTSSLKKAASLCCSE